MPNVKNWVFNPLVPILAGAELARVLVTSADNWATAGKEPILKLYSNDPPITPDIALGDLTECAFTGYANVPQDGPLVVRLGPNGTPMLFSFVNSFAMGATPTVFDQATGLYLVDATELILLGVQRFDDPFPFDEENDFIGVQVQYQFPGWESLLLP
jgi:hypothetical protein